MTTSWFPAESARRAEALARFAEQVGMPGASYDELWRWSVDDVGAFWSAAQSFLGVRWRSEPATVLRSADMPGADWFTGGELSFAEHLFAGRDPADVALRFVSESGRRGTWTWQELERQAARIRRGLVDLGVGRGDRVASYLPNLPEAVAAFAATASIGAVWTAAAPEFGKKAVMNRFGQTAPSVVLGVDGYVYRGRTVERGSVGRAVAAELGAAFVSHGLLDGTGWPADFGRDAATTLTCDAVPFDHPLWILYSSGTTGQPKAIVHGHGGALVELLKVGALQLGLRQSDRFFWYTTTGWVMWNILLSPLLVGASVLLYDGYPDPEGLWDLAADKGVTVFGTSAAWLDAVRTSGSDPTVSRDLSVLRVIGSTGSPLPPECYDWVYETFPADTWLISISGGTDVVTPLLGAAPGVPVYRGELGPPGLGIDLQAWRDDRTPLRGEVGEMVVAQPIPSMPVALWGDHDGSRLRASYFERFPSVYAHGDWLELTERGTGIIRGRSDATINRAGVRIGTAEIYNGLLSVPEVVDALAIDLPASGTHGELVVFVVTTACDDDLLRARIATALRTHCSPRHVPDRIVVVPEIPRTVTGKRVEVPVKRILMGADPADAVNRASLQNPTALDHLVAASGVAVAKPIPNGVIVTFPDYQTIKVDLPRPGVGRITLDRPKSLNALDSVVEREVLAAAAELIGDHKVGAIVIAGSERAFAAGADIAEMVDLTYADVEGGALFSGWDALAALSTPLVAAVSGYALGGGAELAMLCDVIIASETATFGQPEIKLGILPGIGGTQRLTRAIGKAKAMDLCLTGRRMSADEAERSGLVSRVVPAGRLEDEALTVAETIAGMSQSAVAATKASVNRSFEVPLSEGMRYERLAFASRFASADRKEGMSAFIEKRAPNYTSDR